MRTHFRAIIGLLIISIFFPIASSAVDYDLYRISVAGRGEAELLDGLRLNPVMRVNDGYLALLLPDSREKLAASGLVYEMIAAGIDKGRLYAETRHDRGLIGDHRLVFDESGIRVYYVDKSAMPGDESMRGLRPLNRRSVPIIYNDDRQPFDVSAKRAIELDSLIMLVSQDSLYSYVEHLETYKGRESGTYGNRASGMWLTERLSQYGYDSIVGDTFTASLSGQMTLCRNIMAYKIGTDFPYHHLIIGAHRDTRENTPGSDDNGSGVAAVLEMARILKDIDTKTTVTFAFFDAEERGLNGSRHYVDDAYESGEKIVFMLNQDMIAHYENETEIKVVYMHTDVYAQLWADLAASLPGIDLNPHLIKDWYHSDQDSFWEFGYHAILNHEYILSPYIHDPRDSLVYMNFDYMNRVTRTSLATAYAIDQAFVPDYELFLTGLGEYPTWLIPGFETPIEAFVEGYGGAAPVPGSIQLHYATDNGDTVSIEMVEGEECRYYAELPAFPCITRVSYFVSAEDEQLGAIYFPDSAKPVSAIASTWVVDIFEDDFDNDKGWLVNGDATSGMWERANPLDYHKWTGAPNADYDGSYMCYLTDVGLSIDVDNGTTTLISPPIDATGGSVLFSYARWYSNQLGNDPQNDIFKIYISNDGGDIWKKVEDVGPVEEASEGWYFREFMLDDIVTPTDQVHLRFDASDLYDDSHIEAAVDAVKFTQFLGGPLILTRELSNWTAGVEYSIRLESVVCEGEVIWADKYGHLNGSWLTLDSTGLLTGTPGVSGSIYFIATASGEMGGIDEQMYNFNVNPALDITTLSIPNATIGQEYEAQLYSMGGTGVKEWTDRDNDLTEWEMELSSDGCLSGISESEGVVSFTARITDEIGAIDEKSFDLEIRIPFICGDANDDGLVNVGDVVFLVNFIFKGGSAPYPIYAADANSDGEVNVADAVYLINHIFKGGAVPTC